MQFEITSKKDESRTITIDGSIKLTEEEVAALDTLQDSIKKQKLVPDTHLGFMFLRTLIQTIKGG